MSTFAKATFNAAGYASSRPTYPRRLFDRIFDFHGLTGGWETAVDLGCGTGQATAELTRFKKVIGVDPSPGMVQTASANNLHPRYTFKQGNADNLSGVIDDSSVDLVIAAQACHWFDYDKVWGEMSRILRPGGSLAFWVYGEFRLGGYPELDGAIEKFMQGVDPTTSLGPHFQRPGRTILERLLVDVPEPGAEMGFEKLGRERMVMHKTMTWDALLDYLRTASAVHAFHERYPDAEDITLRFWERLKENSDTELVDVHWPLSLLLTRRKHNAHNTA